MSAGETAAPTVLVVDDDEQVRYLVAAALTGAGFRVLLAAGGVEAVAIYCGVGGAIDLVLLDVLMPEMDGPATLVELRRLAPGLRCCFVSAYTGGPAPQELMALGALEFIQKPFRVAELVEVVRRLTAS